MPFVNKNNQLTNAPSVPTQPSTSSASTSIGASKSSSSIPPANDIQNRPVAPNRPANSNNIIVNKCQTCMVNEFTLIVAWSNAEIARYIQLFKSFEKRPPDLIKEKIDNDYMSQLTSVLTTIRGLNKTDVMTLATNFRSFRQIVEASPSELSLCPGLGEKKVKRLLEAFNSDFRNFPKNNDSANN
ncbi:ssDNA endonuclease and repair protein rad10 [Puccinia graminis f. sp. tritici]|uniref:SsDNA endonuclease and repair protein rad10 n=1 Tax=Puccinia graminis f. sp. tritici TaxID=56615 RepID=A0A5B0MFM1_PUCGR|nr:ssDNA endonuclease and repair protein rad10 [Puccinia graminis f. sp. tritici]